MQIIEHDLFGNVVVSETQPQGFGFRERNSLLQLRQNLLLRFEDFLGRASTHGDEERFEAVVNHSAAAK
ncbi:hypothetical protein [Mycobacterium sp.]|uniref:hypothetical protein n=1 Tax=Mycobacterium sp. TaxID=1785 RepID=UPI00260AF949|nr:hypothetical protein [Mycobacterium sp.]